ncbi:MAG: hypothetical protein IKS08_00745 [Alphaproteobacteria bacterium]|nr:hypothetical protein [Alphaproteobacteria bacterium]
MKHLYTAVGAICMCVMGTHAYGVSAGSVTANTSGTARGMITNTTIHQIICVAIRGLQMHIKPIKEIHITW